MFTILPSSSKQLLFDHGINLPSTILLKPLLFNYTDICEFPEEYNIDEIIKTMFKAEFTQTLFVIIFWNKKFTKCLLLNVKIL